MLNYLLRSLSTIINRAFGVNPPLPQVEAGAAKKQHGLGFSEPSCQQLQPPLQPVLPPPYPAGLLQLPPYPSYCLGDLSLGLLQPPTSGLLQPSTSGCPFNMLSQSIGLGLGSSQGLGVGLGVGTSQSSVGAGMGLPQSSMALGMFGGVGSLLCAMPDNSIITGRVVG